MTRSVLADVDNVLLDLPPILLINSTQLGGHKRGASDDPHRGLSGRLWGDYMSYYLALHPAPFGALVCGDFRAHWFD